MCSSFFTLGRLISKDVTSKYLVSNFRLFSYLKKLINYPSWWFLIAVFQFATK